MSSTPYPNVTNILLFAIGQKGIIGRNDKLPWDIPEDLEHFKTTTSGPGKVLLMGRKTWESLPIGKTSGEKLVGRKKIVMTSKSLNPQKDTIFIPLYIKSDVDRLAHNLGFNTIYHIGGRRVIENGVYNCERAIITEVETDPDLEPIQPTDICIRPGLISDNFTQTRNGVIRISPRATVVHYTRRQGNSYLRAGGIDEPIRTGLNPWFNPVRAG